MAKNNNLGDFVKDLADTIRSKKGTTAAINPQEFSSEIESIQTGTDTSDATATAADILSDKTAYGASGKITGTLQKQTKSVQIVTNKQTIISPDAGKLLETVVVTTNVPSKEEQEKTVTITENGTQNVTPDSGKVLSKVTVTTNVPTSSELTEIATAAEMNALLVAANVGKAYKFTGTTDSNYINGDIYEVEKSSSSGEDDKTYNVTLSSYKGSVSSVTAYAYTQYRIGSDSEWLNFPNTTEDAVTITVSDGTILSFKMSESVGESYNMIFSSNGTQIGALSLTDTDNILLYIPSADCTIMQQSDNDIPGYSITITGITGNSKNASGGITGYINSTDGDSFDASLPYSSGQTVEFSPDAFENVKRLVFDMYNAQYLISVTGDCVGAKTTDDNGNLVYEIISDGEVLITTTYLD